MIKINKHVFRCAILIALSCTASTCENPNQATFDLQSIECNKMLGTWRLHYYGVGPVSRTKTWDELTLGIPNLHLTDQMPFMYGASKIIFSKPDLARTINLYPDSTISMTQDVTPVLGIESARFTWFLYYYTPNDYEQNKRPNSLSMQKIDEPAVINTYCIIANDGNKLRLGDLKKPVLLEYIKESQR